MQVLGSHQNVLTTRLVEEFSLTAERTQILSLSDFPGGVHYHHDREYMKVHEWQWHMVYLLLSTILTIESISHSLCRLTHTLTHSHFFFLAFLLAFPNCCLHTTYCLFTTSSRPHAAGHHHDLTTPSLSCIQSGWP